MSSRRRENEKKDEQLLPDRDDERVAWPFTDDEDEDPQPVSVRERSATDKALFELGDDFVYRCHPNHKVNALRRHHSRESR
jgi:hypothetical protein